MLLKWSQNEDAVLRKHYRSGGVSACKHHLELRTEVAIQKRASHLKLVTERDCSRRRHRYERDPLEALIDSAFASMPAVRIGTMRATL